MYNKGLDDWYEARFLFMEFGKYLFFLLIVNNHWTIFYWESFQHIKETKAGIELTWKEGEKYQKERTKIKRLNPLKVISTKFYQFTLKG